MLGNGSQSDLYHPQCSRTSSASLAPLSFSHVASSSQQVSHLALQPVAELDWMETGQQLTFIGHQDTPGIGNIHSGKFLSSFWVCEIIFWFLLFAVYVALAVSAS